ncbi:xylulokinase [Pullulanibacillus camelliae]|uniref:Xylulokinase n=1 Tax=Pullulanibacillus camelliae TaxID=1707096 RepID=A0A8J2VEV9_9BACL|nr:FGGY family carbohydrate kinase [Pullulanibacillus camelliae]GGE27770.1 xylulokinase [Pullulanibacillus camelliae]
MKIKDSVYIGLDIGSTHIKAAAYTTAGDLKSIARLSTPVHVSSDGGIYHLSSELWEKTLKCLIECINGMKDIKIKGIGIASMAESGVFMDADGKENDYILAWYDQRPSHFLKEIQKKVPAKEFFERTGLIPDSKYSLLKMIWMKRFMPDIWKSARTWLNIADFIAYKLTGHMQSEISLDSRTMLFNIKKRHWDQDLIKEFGIKDELFKEPVHSGQLIGKLVEDVARVLKIPKGIPVTIAGHDHIVGAFGIGAIFDGDVTNSCGTAETLIITIPEKDLSQFPTLPPFTIGCHVIPNRHYVLLPVGRTGGIVEWFLSITGWNYDQFLDVLSKDEIKDGSIDFFPIPFDEGNQVQYGWFGGAITHSNSSELSHALIHGLGNLFRNRMELLENLNFPIERLMVIGGSTQNQFWMRTKANILNKNLQIVRDSEAVARGAAILAAKSCGEIEDVPTPPSLTIEPDLKEIDRLEDHYKNRYLKTISNINK